MILPRSIKQTLSVILRYPRITALAAGAITTTAYAPFHIWIMALVGPGLLFLLWLERPHQSLRIGFMYGLGLMGSGVSWLHVSIAQFGDLGWLFPLVVTLGFVALLALFYAALGWLAGFFQASRQLSLILVYPALWVLLEWLRGWFLTGFPWLQIGYSQIDSPLAGYGPLLGVLGISWMALVTVGLLLALANSSRYRVGYLSAVVLIWSAGWLGTKIDWSQPIGEPIRIALIQGNIPQAEKWLPEQLLPSLVLYANKTKENFDRDLIVWPETAVSAFQFQVEEAFIQPLENTVKNHHTHLVFGVVQMDQAREHYYNAMVALGNEERDQYYKRHLVPFTEYLPLKGILWPLVDLFTIPMSDFSTKQDARPLMRVGDYLAGLSICYEDAFGAEMIEALPEAAFLINASNDAWFGKSLAPHQHLQIARMRALETGRYLLRSTNTGISAIIGPRGEILAASPLLELHVLKGEILPLEGETLYARFGNLTILALLLLAMMTGFPYSRIR
ncbi:MAG: apolipoprotein N-acyltransferase [gamma proteobacterium symbiont of Ctena orbiculata]|nr:MAG: apolipoprotein N-acyltransferase [gamma proteobacterium symbiont of Ctena orbiculata]PVV24848.1 MAG: apolipoprotein N-acyltransferase [gamma proteobacterium symbiont of Ctena orbiculata]PVV25955.1 MAG: apolipoprotein N-acyltransferase [gamma proteobacterium symbiont of Ctena orbiculata]